MAFELHRNAFPGLTASQVMARQAVGLVNAERGVGPLLSSADAAHGVALATAAQGDAVTVHDAGNYVKAQAAASLGAAAQIGVVGGATHSLGPVAGASGSIRHAVGQSVTAAAAGELFTLYVNPTQLSDGGAI